MKSFIIAFCLIACAYASDLEKDAPIVLNEFEQSLGGYLYRYETGNGIIAQANGELKSFGKDESAVVVSGSSKYINPDGEEVVITYTADENGYHVSGSHLPTPPPTEPIPEYIARSLEYIAAHPYTQEKN